jgi:hypothetical protein
MKLLPFPWVVATRPLARRLVEHVESCNRIIGRLEIRLVRAQDVGNQMRAEAMNAPPVVASALLDYAAKLDEALADPGPPGTGGSPS